jgi:hypothetical protein
MGTVWTLNASAEEAPEAEAPAAVVAPVAAESEPAAAPVPPKLLPWGAKPKKIKRARPGADSAAIADAGAGAAPADTSGSLTPKAKYEPKGLSPRGPSGKGMRSVTIPPAPPVPPSVTGTVTAAAAADAKPFYHYMVGTQIGDTDGTWANLTIERPELAEGDSHTLAEIAVADSGGNKRNAVEIGWTVDRSVNAGPNENDPHLFVYFWKDGVTQCYNACGFTMYSKTVKPGDTLPAGTSKRFGIQHANGAWWVAYDSEWIGFFPDKNWEGRFTKGLVSQWFGEVASAKLETCTQMGNGKLSTNGNAARIGSISMTNGPAVAFGLDPRPKYKADPDPEYDPKLGEPIKNNPKNPGQPETPGVLEPYRDPPTSSQAWFSPWTGSMIGDLGTTFRYGGPTYPIDERTKRPTVKC